MEVNSELIFNFEVKVVKLIHHANIYKESKEF